MNHKKIITRLDKKNVQKIVKSGLLQNKLLYNIDFTKIKIKWKFINLINTAFIKCKFRDVDISAIINNGGIFIPQNKELPFNIVQEKLYTQKSIKELNIEKIHNSGYQNFFEVPNIEIFKRIHDLSISYCLNDYLNNKSVIGFMGGHNIGRNTDLYKDISLLSKKLSGSGYLIVTGGGPGIMEAANLGAYFSRDTEDNVIRTIKKLSSVPLYTMDNYLNSSEKIVNTQLNGSENLSIPTLHYINEPINKFATRIAMFFSVHEREYWLLKRSNKAIIVAPGSMGTLNEIFSFLSQLKYDKNKEKAPIILFGKDFFSKQINLYALLKKFSIKNKISDVVFISDSIDEVYQIIETYNYK